MAKNVRVCRLDEAGMEEISEEVRQFVQESNLGRREATATWLEFDDALISWGAHFGPETEALLIHDRLGGKKRITVRIEGDQYDPRDADTRESWSATLCESAGTQAVYAYRRGCNNLILVQPQPPLSVLLKVLIAVGLGVLVAVAGYVFLPEAGRTYLLENFFNRFFDVYVGALGGLAGPLVFFSVAWGICGIGDMSALARNGSALLKNFFHILIVSAIISVVASVFVFPLSGSREVANGDFVQNIMSMIAGLVPTNFIKPFSEGNTLQIIVLAVGIGVAALALGDATKGMRSVIRQCNSIMMFLMEQICRFLPVFIFVVIVSQTWSGTLAKLLSTWFPILFATGLMFVLFLAQCAYVSWRTNMPFKQLFHICLPVLLLGTSTASSSACLGLMMSSCDEELHVDSEFASFGIPLGTIICKMGTVVELAVFMCFIAQSADLSFDLSWYVHLVIVSVLYAVVVPPVPGGMIACLSLLLAELGLPGSTLALLTAMDIIADYPSTGTGVVSDMLAVFSTAKSLGLVTDEPTGKQANSGDTTELAA